MSASADRGHRYRRLFERLAGKGEGAFVPFVVLGDPDPPRSLEIIRILLAAGADALELGLPFSDPVADGPAVQSAHARALAAGVTLDDCWTIIGAIREIDTAIPIGLLAYSNLILTRGAPVFFAGASAAGVDSVLAPDIPVHEAGDVSRAARAAAIAPVFIVPPNVDDDRLSLIARESEGYVYVTARPGVTGASSSVGAESAALVARLSAVVSNPPMIGFGISTPEQVRGALEAGAAGVIAGSAIIRMIHDGRQGAGIGDETLSDYIRIMKAATTGAARRGVAWRGV